MAPAPWMNYEPADSGTQLYCINPRSSIYKMRKFHNNLTKLCYVHTCIIISMEYSTRR